MAISSNDNIKALLKVWYKDGVSNLLFRNSPVLKMIQKNRIEGKTYNFSAMYGSGGAVGGDFTKVRTLAANTSKNVEFAVEPGQLFSSYTMNAKEVQASQTQKGAYMKVAGAKMFAATDGFRKTLAAAIYGRGYGELCFAPETALTAGTEVDITLTDTAVMSIGEGTVLAIKTSVAGGATDVKATLTVVKTDGNTVTVIPSATYTPAATDVICLDGSIDSAGNPLLPMGLAGWLPAVGERKTDTWKSYIKTKFFGVDRSVAPDRLAGAFYEETSSTAKMADAVQTLMQKCRRQGSLADMLVINDEDWVKLSKEIEASNSYFTQTSTKSKKSAVIGYSSFAASFSTNYIENIIDDPFCPKGQFFILDSSAVEFDTLTNTDKINDGIANNDPGKADPMSENDNGKADAPYKLIIDDYISVNSGTASIEGPSSEVSLILFGSLVITNPSVCGTGLFYGANSVSLSA